MPLISLWRDRRREAELTQEEVARELGVSRPVISQYETGETFAGKDVQEAACRLFNCQTSDLYRYVPDEEKSPVG